MRYHKGKWKAAAKDTYCVETTLDKIVLAHITKLYDLIKDRETVGIPMTYVEQQAALQGVDKYSDDVDLDAAHQLRLRDLEELIWTYSDNEPVMEDYNFHIEMIPSKPKDNGNVPVEFKITNQEGRDKYHAAQEVYWERKLKGYELAGKLWRELSW